ncbi:GntT/GntP/DsdX family permease [Kytococcus sp. Marseille-QA3725]
MGSMDVARMAVALAIASGSMCTLQMNSNFFWMFTSLLGLTPRGGLKTMTTVTSIGPVLPLGAMAADALVA